MYPKYFGLSEPGFSITPDPHYLFLSEQHREALAHLLYGAGENGGFVLLTGEVGTGKTTVCRAFLEQLPDGVEAALVLNPALSGVELIASVCDEFGVERPEEPCSTKTLLDRLNHFLLDCHAQGRRPVLVIDEAQSLQPSVLEQVRLLTNLETTKHKLLQIFLIGQPELRTLLATEQLRQLNQRITARFHLTPLTLPETAAYIRHRLSVAGVDRPLFSRAAVRRVYSHAGGVPRLINLICDRALLGAAVSHRLQANRRIVDRAAREVRGEERQQPWPVRPWLTAVAAATLAGAVGLWIGSAGLLPRQLSDWPVIGSASQSDPHSQPAKADGLPLDNKPEAPADSVSSDPGELESITALAEASSEPAYQEPVTEEAVDAAPTPDPGSSPDADAASSNQSGTESDEAEDLALAPTAGDESSPPVSSPGFPRLSSMPLAGLAQTDSPALARLLLNQQEAGKRLLNAWGMALAPGADTDCAGAESLGLACLIGEGRWTDLRRFDRPVALALRMEDGSEGHVLVVGLDDELARLDLADGGEPVAVPIADIDERWSGRYWLLWRLPPGGDPVVGRSARPEAVRWLRDRLGELSGDQEAPPDTGRYDNALMRRVRAFQTDYGLDVDGLAGPHTLIVLANLLADRGPPVRPGSTAANAALSDSR